MCTPHEHVFLLAPGLGESIVAPGRTLLEMIWDVCLGWAGLGWAGWAEWAGWAGPGAGQECLKQGVG